MEMVKVIVKIVTTSNMCDQTRRFPPKYDSDNGTKTRLVPNRFTCTRMRFMPWITSCSDQALQFTKATTT